jgi:S-adenosylmethionine-dependent methyltransferase
MTDLFSEKLATWREYTETPWARIRYAVVEEVLRRQTGVLGERIRVLDVGGGDGMDALPLALAGHDVTVVDPSEAWLAEAGRRAAEQGVALTTLQAGLDDLDSLAGGWDLVLCHFVLRYRPASSTDIARLARRVRLGGRLSVMDANPDGRVLRELLLAGPAAASDELHSDSATVHTFETQVRKVSTAEVRSSALAAGLVDRGIFGNRIANDLLLDNNPKFDPEFFDELLRLELELCDRAPFHQIGAAWQLIFERGGTGSA